jgi:hypothetical protein
MMYGKFEIQCDQASPEGSDKFIIIGALVIFQKKMQISAWTYKHEYIFIYFLINCTMYVLVRY